MRNNIQRFKLAALGVVLVLVVFASLYAPIATASFRYGTLVHIEQLTFDPDMVKVPGDSFLVLVIQNREEEPIQHEVRSKDLFESGTMISVQGTGTVEYDSKRVSRVLLFPAR